MNLCVIPARGGSKRIPRKNIKEFCGKPMIAYAIEAAQSSKLFSQIIVSTDDSEIAEVSRQFGAQVPFIRPAELADDFSPTVAVVRHAVAEAERLRTDFENVCCIYPAVPLLQQSDLRMALALLNGKLDLYSFPIAEFPSSSYRALKLGANNKLEPVYPEYELERSQDLGKTYHDAGQFYWAHKAAWQSIEKIHANGLGFIIPRWRVVDIDTQEDWEMAELLYRALVRRGNEQP
jgi:pseudaminic acid cytidylyltransferase